MAEIKIEKKKSVWPWILVAVLLILALLYFFVWADNDDDDMDDMDDMNTEQVMEEDEMVDDTTNYSEAGTTGYAAAVNEYDTYINDPKMGRDHEYANGALLKLIAAVEATADKIGVNIEADLEKAKSEAQDIKKDPMAVTHANGIKKAGDNILNALETMQKEKFPDMGNAYTKVETAYKKIEGNKETLNQKDAVKSFFQEASTLLNSMK